MTDADDARTVEPADADAGPLLVKLGGSVVTVKDRPETVDRDALASAAAALADASTGLVVVHGGGSFGHHHAAERGVSTTDGTRDADSVLAIHRAMVDLNRAVVDALGDAGLRAVPVHPLSTAARDGAGGLTLATDAVAGLLAEGFVPVLHGDVVAHAGEGVTVLSGDELVTSLAAAVEPSRVGVCSTVPGVLDADGAVVDRIGSIDEVADALGGSDVTDVTGGMAGKVRALLRLDVPAQVFGPAALADFVAGGTPGTTVDGD